MLRLCLNYSLMWVASIVWHVWRIAIGRPAYALLGDTARTVGSFHAAYYLGSIFVGVWLEDASVAGVIVEAIIANLVILLLWERKDRSSALACVMLLTPVLFKLAYFGIDSLGLFGTAGTTVVAIVYWFAIQLRAGHQFFTGPVHQQQPGYRR